MKSLDYTFGKLEDGCSFLPSCSHAAQSYAVCSTRTLMVLKRLPRYPKCCRLPGGCWAEKHQCWTGASTERTGAELARDGPCWGLANMPYGTFATLNASGRTIGLGPQALFFAQLCPIVYTDTTQPALYHQPKQKSFVLLEARIHHSYLWLTKWRKLLYILLPPY